MLNFLDLWLIDISTVSDNYSMFRGGSATRVLSDDEVEKAGRFRFEKDRVQYVRSHIALRMILSKYMGVNSGEIDFERGERGKPFAPQAESLFFNLSHSGEYVSVVLSNVGTVGVDIELWNDKHDCMSLVNSSFSEFEKAELRKIVDYNLVETFFDVWVRKEAFIKAIGQGLAFPLKYFDVTVSPLEVPRILNIKSDEFNGRQWRLFDFNIEGRYSGAVVVEGGSEQLRRFNYTFGEILSFF